MHMQMQASRPNHPESTIPRHQPYPIDKFPEDCEIKLSENWFPNAVSTTAYYIIAFYCSDSSGRDVAGEDIMVQGTS